MSKRSIALLAVLGGLAVLVGVYLYLQFRPAPPTPLTEGAKPELLKLDKEQLVKIVLSARPEGTLTLVRKDTSWTVADYPYPVTLSESNVDDLVLNFTALFAERVINESPTDLAPFGLEPPRAVGQGFFADGTVKTILLGDKTPAGNTYYLMLLDDPKLYTVWMNVGEHLHWKVNNLRDSKLAPAINADEVTYLKVRLRSGQVLEAIEKTPEENKQYQLGFGKYLMTKPYAQPRGMDDQKFDPVMRGPSGIQIDEFVDDAPKNPAQYGLDRPWGEVLVRDKANTLDLLLGADRGADRVCFKIAGRPEVYAVDKYRLSFMDTKPFDLMDKFVFIPNIEDVDQVDIQSLSPPGGKTHVLTMSRVTKKATEQGGQDEVVTTYKVDGKEAEEGSFKKFYQALIGLTLEGEVARQVPNNPVVKVHYRLNKGARREATVSFAPYDKVFYAAFVDGVGGFALTQAQLQGMLAKLDDLVAGKEVTD